MNSELLGKPADYVAALNLQQDPFENTLADHFFYADPGLMQRLDLLQHLTQFGDQLLLIAGPRGSGKSTLLSQFRLRAKDNWHICQLDGGKYESAAHLLHDMADFYNTPYGDDNAMIGRELIQHARSLQQDAGLAIVIIDDADQLNDDCLAALFNLGESPQEALRYLRIVLLGEPSLESRLLSLGLNNPRNPIIHRLDMQPFDTQQSAAYLMYRLAIAGYSGDSPFSSTEVEAMHKAAGGLPGKLNEFARETLGETIERKLAAKKAAQDKPAKTRPAAGPAASAQSKGKPPLPVLATGGVVLLAGILWFSGVLDQGDDAELQTQPLQLPDEVKPVVIDQAEPESTDSEIIPIVRMPPEKRIADVAEPSITVNPPVTTTESEPEPATDTPEPAATVAQTPPAVEQETEQTTVTTDDTEARAALQAEIEKELAAIESPSEPEPKPKPEPAKPAAKPTAPDARLPAWVAAAPEEHYTLQLVGLSKESSATAYLKQHGLGDRAAIITSERKGAPWFTVIYGDFPDKASAQSAALPDSLKSAKPWPRTFAAVREAATP